MSNLLGRAHRMLFGAAKPDQPQQRPRIGITGSFGRGNYGDELYVKNYQHWMGPWADLFLLSGLPRASYFSGLANNYVDMMDAVVLGGGDLLCPYRAPIDRDFINPMYLRRPVHVAGIGVERNRPEIDPSVVAQWQSFLTHPSITSVSTRDPGSRDWVEKHVKPAVRVGVHPDMVCALPLPAASRPSGPPIIGVTTRHIKNPKDYVQMQEVLTLLSEQGWRVRHIIGGVGVHGEKDLENANHLQVPGKETMFSQELDDISRALGECTLLLSMKLHTTLVATMYGVPTICINPSIKARAFLQSIGRPELAVVPTKSTLLELIKTGVPDVPMEKVQRLRDEAQGYMRTLSQRIWDDYRNATPARRQTLATTPTLPG